jgi:hypothetical protein
MSTIEVGVLPMFTLEPAYLEANIQSWEGETHSLID